MDDELIRLDTTIIGIDSLINKASTAKEAKVLFTVKDVIYSQQRYFADAHPVKHGRWIISNIYAKCSECSVAYDLDTFQRLIPMNENVPRHCSYCGARMMKED